MIFSRLARLHRGFAARRSQTEAHQGGLSLAPDYVADLKKARVELLLQRRSNVTALVERRSDTEFQLDLFFKHHRAIAAIEEAIIDESKRLGRS